MQRSFKNENISRHIVLCFIFRYCGIYNIQIFNCIGGLEKEKDMLKRLNKKANAIEYITAFAFVNAIIVFNVF